MIMCVALCNTHDHVVPRIILKDKSPSGQSPSYSSGFSTWLPPQIARKGSTTTYNQTDRKSSCM